MILHSNFKSILLFDIDLASKSDDDQIPTDEELSSYRLFNNRYKVKKVLGEGAFGKVYVVFDTKEKKK